MFLIAPEGAFGKSEVVVPAGSAGYSDAAVFVPWRIYRAYGDVRLLSEQWSSMARWVDRCARIAATVRHPDRVRARPVPEPHERYLLDTGVHFGEWLAPPSPVDQWNPGLDAGQGRWRFRHGLLVLLSHVARAHGSSCSASTRTRPATGSWPKPRAPRGGPSMAMPTGQSLRQRRRIMFARWPSGWLPTICGMRSPGDWSVLSVKRIRMSEQGPLEQPVCFPSWRMPDMPMSR